MAGKMTTFIFLSIAFLGGVALWTAFVQGCPLAQKHSDILVAALAFLGLVEMWQTLSLTMVDEAITAAGRAAVYFFFITEISPYKLLAYISAALIVGLAVYAALKREGRL